MVLSQKTIPTVATGVSMVGHQTCSDESQLHVLGSDESQPPGILVEEEEERWRGGVALTRGEL